MIFMTASIVKKHKKYISASSTNVFLLFLLLSSSLKLLSCRAKKSEFKRINSKINRSNIFHWAIRIIICLNLLSELDRYKLIFLASERHFLYPKDQTSKLRELKLFLSSDIFELRIISKTKIEYFMFIYLT